MSEMFNPHAPATAYDHNRTIVAVLELSGKNWLLGAVAPGLSRRTKRSFEARNVEAVLWAVEQAKEESAKARFEVARIVVGFESGRDGSGLPAPCNSAGWLCTPPASPWSGAAGAPRLTASTWIFC
jgi:hypothetical protein